MCFGLGVVGWLIPVVTGIPFYVAAIVLLAMASERARGWVNTLERRLAHDTRVAMRRWLHRIPFLRQSVSHPDEEAGAPGRPDEG